MSKTYELEELAKLLRFNKAYIKMALKKFDEYEKDQPVPEELAAKLAEMLSRPWPPENA